MRLSSLAKRASPGAPPSTRPPLSASSWLSNAVLASSNDAAFGTAVASSHGTSSMMGAHRLNRRENGAFAKGLPLQLARHIDNSRKWAVCGLWERVRRMINRRGVGEELEAIGRN